MTTLQDPLESVRFRLLRQVMLEAHMAREAGTAIDEFIEALRCIHGAWGPIRVAKSGTFSGIVSRGLR